MNANFPWAGALLGTALAVSLAAAEPYCSPALHVYLHPAPDACGPGFYTICPNGAWFGPNYWLRPPWEPFNGPSKTLCVSVGQKIMADKLPAQAPQGGPHGPQSYGPQSYGPQSMGPRGPYAPGYGNGPAYNPNLPNYGYAPNPQAPGYSPNPSLPVYGSTTPPGQAPTGFPTHPYLRSPRDFFMWRENMEDQMRRDQRPSLVP